MTRLIDADSIPWDVDGVGEIPVITKEEIDAMPTVEAVPADYIREKIRDLDNSIKNYVGRFDHSAAVDAWFHQRGALEGLIAEWEDSED